MAQSKSTTAFSKKAWGAFLQLAPQFSFYSSVVDAGQVNSLLNRVTLSIHAQAHGGGCGVFVGFAFSDFLLILLPGRPFQQILLTVGGQVPSINGASVLSDLIHAELRPGHQSCFHQG